MGPLPFMKYRPLDQTKIEIRLLTIHSSNGPLVRCALEYVPLTSFLQAHHMQEFEDQAKVTNRLQVVKDSLKSPLRSEPPSQTSKEGYMALSYTWGDSGPLQEMIINEETVGVPENLSLALHALQKDPDILQGLGLWVDMLCINLGDLEERRHQVKFMQHIYALARRIVIWLGPQADFSDKVIGLLRNIHMEGNNKKMTSLAVAKMLARHLDRILWESTKQFFLRPYFNRLWILQELAAGPKNALLICGTRKVRWAVIRYGAEVLWKHLDYFLAKFPVRQRTWNTDTFGTALRRICRLNELKGSNPFENVYKVFDLGVTSQVTDERDRIYGLRGLLHYQISSRIDPTYKITKPDVYLGFAKAFIEATHCLDIIYLGSLKRTSSSWPTWIPNWSIGHEMTLLSFSRAMSFNACGNSLAEVHFSGEGKYLSCKGMLFDVIYTNECDSLVMDNNSCVAPYIKPSGLIRQDGYANMDFLRVCLQDTMVMADPTPEESYSGALDRQISIFAIPWCDDEAPNPAMWELWSKHGWRDCRYRDRYFFRSFQQFRLRHARFNFKGYNFKDFFPPSVIDCEDSEKIGQLLNSISAGLMHRRLVSTKGGFLGLATENVRDEDCIFILRGCRFPVVLRPHGEYYQVVGEIYVYGIMGGEAMKGREEDLQEVVLC